MEKILAFDSNKSFLSIPFPLGFAPNKKIQSASPKPLFKSEVTSTEFNSGNAQSNNSSFTPNIFFSKSLMSINLKFIFVSLP